MRTLKYSTITTAAFVALLLAVVSASAQTTPVKLTTNFAGTWVLDAAKSDLPKNTSPSVVGQTLSITQDAKTIAISQVTTLDNGLPANTAQFLFNLDGAESTAEFSSSQGPIPAKLIATVLSNERLQLAHSWTMDIQPEPIQVSQTDIYELSDGGRTMTIRRTRSRFGSPDVTTWVYRKK